MVSRIHSDKPAHVCTLGHFMVCGEDKVSFDIVPRSQKLWDVFKYLLVNRSRSIPAEVIMESLYPNDSYEDPKNAMQNLIYRLRKQLRECMPVDDNMELIRFQNGCYRLNTLCFDIDTDLLERMIRQGGKLKKDNIPEAIACYTQAVEIYHGDFLPEMLYADWVVPLRNYYRRLYIQCCLDLCEIFKKQRQYDDIIRLCEKATLIEPYEEEIHTCFMEALIREGRIREARSHYEYITSLIYNKFGTKPSMELRRAYQAMHSLSVKSDPDIGSMQKKSDREEPERTGAHICDTRVFRSLFTVQKSQSERRGQPIAMLLVEWTARSVKPNQKEMEGMMNGIAASLRAGDVITQWSDSQILILLSDIHEIDTDKIIRRIKKTMTAADRLSEDEIHIRSQSVLPPL